jgi:hypothetical protein
MRLCLCGCGGATKGENDFINHHNIRGKFHCMLSPETRKKASDSKLGEKNPAKRPEERKKMSELKSGENNPNYGKKGILSTRYGIPHTSESRKLMAKRMIHYSSPLQGEIILRSHHEELYANFLDSKKRLWLYEPETFDLGETTYLPDFFLVNEEKFVELKETMYFKDKEKIRLFLEQYPFELEIIYNWQVEELCKSI